MSERAAHIREAAKLVMQAANAVSDLLRSAGEPGPALALIGVHTDLMRSHAELEHLAKGFEAVDG